VADSGGHWANLAEVEKLSQSKLLKGVVDIAPKRGPVLSELPIRQVSGLSTKWNRSDARRTATRMAIGQELLWTDNVTYTQMDLRLAQFYDQTPLNKFVRDVYKDKTDYATQQLLEMRTGIIETLNDALIYDDSDYTGLHMRGLYHWAVDNVGTDGYIDNGEAALSFMNVRKVLDYMSHGCDFMVMSYSLARYIDQFYQDAGPTSWAGTMGRIVWDKDEIGKPMMVWAGTPIIRSDYMVAEQANTGAGLDARAKYSSGVAMYSILFVCKGKAQKQMVDPGAIIHFGGEDRESGELFKVERFDKLEKYDAAGLRLVSYLNLGVGAPRACCAIYDITLDIPTP